MNYGNTAGVPPVSVRAGVPPVSVRVIVRSAHSALVRQLCNPRSLFIVYDLSVCLRRRTCHKVKTASSEFSVRVQSGTKWSDRRELPSAGTHRRHSAGTIFVRCCLNYSIFSPEFI